MISYPLLAATHGDHTHVHGANACTAHLVQGAFVNASAPPVVRSSLVMDPPEPGVTGYNGDGAGFRWGQEGSLGGGA